MKVLIYIAIFIIPFISLFLIYYRDKEYQCRTHPNYRCDKDRFPLPIPTNGKCDKNNDTIACKCNNINNCPCSWSNLGSYGLEYCN